MQLNPSHAAEVRFRTQRLKILCQHMLDLVRYRTKGVTRKKLPPGTFCAGRSCTAYLSVSGLRFRVYIYTYIYIYIYEEVAPGTFCAGRSCTAYLNVCVCVRVRERVSERVCERESVCV